jgi:predicted MPP superfamily phosphohydrolase
LTADSLIIFIGDYIDRGEDAKGVIDLIIKLKKHYNIVTLKGNHEPMCLEFYEDKNTPKAGLSIFNGAGATLGASLSRVNREEDPFFPSCYRRRGSTVGYIRIEDSPQPAKHCRQAEPAGNAIAFAVQVPYKHLHEDI